MQELRASKEFDIRFSEVDSMNVVWHGAYPLYFEDAREAFGNKYGLSYMLISSNGFYAPLVELSFQYKKPIFYWMRPRIDIIYKPVRSAKIIFDYEIHDTEDDSFLAIGHSVQVFTDKQYQLELYMPNFYRQWREKWGQII